MGKSSGDETQVKPPGFVKGAGKDLAGAAGDVYQQGPLQYFPDQTYANLDPRTIAGLTQQEQFALNTFPQLNEQILGSLGQSLDMTNMMNNPAVTAGLQNIEDRANRNFRESVLPQLRQQATGTGNQYASKAEQSERLAARDLQGMISEAQASLLSGTVSDAMRAQNQALALAPQTAQNALFGANALRDVGGAYQLQDQLGINEAMNRYNYNQQAPGNLVSQYASHLTPIFGGSMGQTTTDGGGSNMLGSMLGGGLLGAGMTSMPFFSGTGAGAGAGAGLAGLAGGWALPIAGMVAGGLLS